ncbi:hypothetical protein [Streptosporangium sp. NPDC000396]|uniref:hypothetical protein n=1 Tax=Streptosporangium sp. NPDC000396 TaxID=3366185 RepID=UPI003699453B
MRRIPTRMLTAPLAVTLGLTTLAQQPPYRPDGTHGSARASVTARSAATYPAWTYGMKVWPFDILNPGDTEASIRERLDEAKNRGANTVIFYLEEEQMYDSFVDEAGFRNMLTKIRHLLAQAHSRALKAVCYLNGAEVITREAVDSNGRPTGRPTLASTHPDWLQQDISGRKMAFTTTTRVGWVPPRAADDWASPYSGWRDFFKGRLTTLGEAGLDGVYIDATSLPGTVFGTFWASSDPGFAQAFRQAYGLDVPREVDWNSPAWRRFVHFRHEAVRDYLADLAGTARAGGVTPFFEMSSLDNETGTELGNDNQFTVGGGIAVSPEVEPAELDGGFKEAFRAAKASRDADQTFPMWFLGWPERNATQARREYAITLALSGNYYPTDGSAYPPNAFPFLDTLRPILDRRVPYAKAALLYPMRSKDFTYPGPTVLTAYNDAFTALARRHVPFRIVPQDGLTAADLAPADTVVLGGAQSMSDQEHALIAPKAVALVGPDNATKDRWFEPKPRSFPNTVPVTGIGQGLPFTVSAPTGSFIEYYTDRDDPNHYYLFSYNDTPSGAIKLTRAQGVSVRIHKLDRPATAQSGPTVTSNIAANEYLTVLDVTLS